MLTMQKVPLTTVASATKKAITSRVLANELGHLMPNCFDTVSTTVVKPMRILACENKGAFSKI